MKLVLSLFVFLSFHFSSYSQNSYGDLSEKARVEGKPILIIFSGSDWCAGCIRLKENVLNTNEFQDYAIQNLLIYTADFPRAIEQQEPNMRLENELLASKWNNKGIFPKVVLLNSNEKLLKDHEGGFKTPQELIKWLKK